MMWLHRNYGWIVIILVALALFLAGYVIGRHGAKTATAATTTTSGTTTGQAEQLSVTINSDGTVTDDAELIVLNPRRYYDVPLDETTQNVMFDCCELYGLDPALVLAVIDVESDFDQYAVSDTHDIGLMQINTSNWEWIASELGGDALDLMDAADNIRAGCWLLDYYIGLADGDIVRGLEAYNMGPSGLETDATGYADMVMEAMDGYQQ